MHVDADQSADSEFTDSGSFNSSFSILESPEYSPITNSEPSTVDGDDDDNDDDNDDDGNPIDDISLNSFTADYQLCESPIPAIPPCENNDHLPEITVPPCVTYKIVGDNIDKNVSPKYMRAQKFRTVSHHMFHSFAVADRIDTSLLNDELESLCLQSPETVAKSFLPSMEDDVVLKRNIQILISRILIKHFSFFELCFKDLVPHHIHHKFHQEMSRKSEVVSIII